MTRSERLILSALAVRDQSGAELMISCRLSSSCVYVDLILFERSGYVSSLWIEGPYPRGDASTI